MTQKRSSDISPSLRELRPANRNVEESSADSTSDKTKQGKRKMTLTSEACDLCRQKKIRVRRERIFLYPFSSLLALACYSGSLEVYLMI